MTVDVGGVVAGPVTLQDTALVADASTPPDTSAGPVVQRLARVAGRTPLLVWGHRNDPATAVQVTVRVVDPLARQAEETVLVPAWVEPVPELHLEIVDVFRIVGRGYVATWSRRPTQGRSLRTCCPWWPPCPDVWDQSCHRSVQTGRSSGPCGRSP